MPIVPQGVARSAVRGWPARFLIGQFGQRCQSCLLAVPGARYVATSQEVEAEARVHEGKQTNQAQTTQSRTPSIFDYARSGQGTKRHGQISKRGIGLDVSGKTQKESSIDWFPGRGTSINLREAEIRQEAESHMRGVDTTRIPLSRKEMSFRKNLDRAPDHQTNTEAREDAEDKFGSNKKPPTKGRKRKPRPGPVTIPMT